MSTRIEIDDPSLGAILLQDGSDQCVVKVPVDVHATAVVRSRCIWCDAILYEETNVPVHIVSSGNYYGTTNTDERTNTLIKEVYSTIIEGVDGPSPTATILQNLPVGPEAEPLHEGCRR